MMKFDLGLPPDVTNEKEVMPRLSKSGIFYAIRKDNILQVFSQGGFVFQYKVPGTELPAAITFTEGKYAKHVVECYQQGKDILTPYEIIDSDEIPEILDHNAMEVIGGVDLEALQAVMHAASTDTIKPVFNGICLFSGKKRNGVAATDSHRLSFFKCDLHGLEEPVIIPLDFVKIIQAGVEVLKNKKDIYVRAGNIISNIIEENFPNIEQVFPSDMTEYVSSITVKDEKILQECYNLLAEPTTAIVFLGNNKIQIRAGEYPELDLDYSSEMENPIALNFSFLLDALKVSKTFRFMDSLTNKTAPIIFEKDNQIEMIMSIVTKTNEEKSE